MGCAKLVKAGLMARRQNRWGQAARLLEGALKRATDPRQKFAISELAFELL